MRLPVMSPRGLRKLNRERTDTLKSQRRPQKRLVQTRRRTAGPGPRIPVIRSAPNAQRIRSDQTPPIGVQIDPRWPCVIGVRYVPQNVPQLIPAVVPGEVGNPDPGVPQKYISRIRHEGGVERPPVRTSRKAVLRIERWRKYKTTNRRRAAIKTHPVVIYRAAAADVDRVVAIRSVSAQCAPPSDLQERYNHSNQEKPELFHESLLRGSASRRLASGDAGQEVCPPSTVNNGSRRRLAHLGADSPLGLPAGYAVLVCALLGLSKPAIVCPPCVHGGIRHFPAHFAYAPGFAPAPEPTPGPSASAPSNPIFERSCAFQPDFRVKYRSKRAKARYLLPQVPVLLTLTLPPPLRRAIPVQGGRSASARSHQARHRFPMAVITHSPQRLEVILNAGCCHA